MVVDIWFIAIPGPHITGEGLTYARWGPDGLTLTADKQLATPFPEYYVALMAANQHVGRESFPVRP